MPRDLLPIIANLNRQLALPLGIFGAPGQGKTTLAAQLFALTPHTSIFLNWQEEYTVEHIKGVQIRHGFPSVWKALQEHEGRAPPKIVWNPDPTLEDPSAPVFEACRALYKWKVKTKDPRRVVIFFDEAQNYAQRDGAFENFCRLGRRRNLLPIVITHFPVSLSNRRIVGSLANGWSTFFLDASQWSAITESFRIKRPDWLETYCAPLSFRAVYFDHVTWRPLDGGVADGNGTGSGSVSEPEEDSGVHNGGKDAPRGGVDDAHEGTPSESVDAGGTPGGAAPGSDKV